MARAKYFTVSLPQSIIEKVDDIIKKGIGSYTSRSDFFKDAARHLFKEFKK